MLQELEPFCIFFLKLGMSQEHFSLYEWCQFVTLKKTTFCQKWEKLRSDSDIRLSTRTHTDENLKPENLVRGVLKACAENPELQTFLVLQPSQITIYHGLSSLFIAPQNVSKSSILQAAKGLQVCNEKSSSMHRLAHIQTCSLTFLQAVISQSFRVPESSGQIYPWQRPTEVTEVAPKINSSQ